MNLGYASTNGSRARFERMPPANPQSRPGVIWTQRDPLSWLRMAPVRWDASANLDQPARAGPDGGTASGLPPTAHRSAPRGGDRLARRSAAPPAYPTLPADRQPHPRCDLVGLAPPRRTGQSRPSGASTVPAQRRPAGGALHLAVPQVRRKPFHRRAFPRLVRPGLRIRSSHSGSQRLRTDVVARSCQPEPGGPRCPRGAQKAIPPAPTGRCCWDRIWNHLQRPRWARRVTGRSRGPGRAR